MNRTYEAMVLLDNREVKKGWQGLKDQVCGLFTKHGAEIKSARRWDERRLAYPIKNQLRGTYLLLYFEAPTASITGIRRDLDYTESVLRHMALVCEVIPESAFDPEAAFDESAVRVEDTHGTAQAASAADDADSGDDAELAAEGSNKKAGAEEADGEESDA